MCGLYVTVVHDSEKAVLRRHERRTVHDVGDGVARLTCANSSGEGRGDAGI